MSGEKCTIAVHAPSHFSARTSVSPVTVADADSVIIVRRRTIQLAWTSTVDFSHATQPPANPQSGNDYESHLDWESRMCFAFMYARKAL